MFFLSVASKQSYHWFISQVIVLIQYICFLVFITSYHKLNGIEQHTFVISQFCRLESAVNVPGFSAQVLSRVTTKVCYLGPRVLSQAHWLLEEFSSLGLQDLHPVFLLAISWGLFSASGGCSQFLAMWLPQAVHMNVYFFWISK